MELTRRQLIGTAMGTAGGLGAAGRGKATRRDYEGRAGAQEAQISRRFVIPGIEAFEGNYRGQFLFIDEATEEGPQAVDIGTCRGADWSDDETKVYRAQLLDRRQEEPLAVEIDAYADGTKPAVNTSSFFVINGVGQCAGDYVSLECEWVTRRSLVGEPPGPTVAETETGGQPGFDRIRAIVGVVGGVAFYVFRRLQ